jgi:hypothetical protein
MVILEFILALSVVLLMVTGVPIGVWHLVYTLRRKHRLESQADARANAKQMAEDFAAITKELSEGATMNYQDYFLASGTKKELQKAE